MSGCAQQVSGGRPRPSSFDELVEFIAEVWDKRDLAWALAGQMATMGSEAEWDSQMVEWVAHYTVEIAARLALPSFTDTDSDDDLRFWCSVHPDLSVEHWRERYGWTQVYTVVGAWSDCEPLAFGAIEGIHQVAGGQGYRGFHPWSTAVSAVDEAEALELAVEEMRIARDDSDEAEAEVAAQTPDLAPPSAGCEHVPASAVRVGDVMPADDGTQLHVVSVTPIPGGSMVLLLLGHSSFRVDDAAKMILDGDRLVTICKRSGELNGEDDGAEDVLDG